MISTIPKIWQLLVIVAVCAMSFPATSIAQDFGLTEDLEPVESEATRKFRELTDPDARAEEADRQKRPPFEFYRTQVAPFDVLTFVKENHWVSFTQEMKANLFDYEGSLRTSPILLRDMPRSVVFRRDARLPKGESMRLSWPAFLPSHSRSLDIELVRPSALRPDDTTQAPLLPMLAHQMLVVVLGEDPAVFDLWKRYQAVVPATTDLDDQQLVERRSYYRVVIPQEPGKPNLPTHPLTWTTISHVVWDGLDPATLDVGQQRAMIDWLHWGGQLIITGGASSSLALLSDSESFLAPYLPGEPSPDSSTLTEADLLDLSNLYPPPVWKIDRLSMASGDYSINPSEFERAVRRSSSRYGPVDPIDLPPDRPLFLSGLAPLTDDASWITDDQGRRFGIERRVGRGRILILAFDPKESAFLGWKGNDTFVRRVILRRPEDLWNPLDPNNVFMHAGPALSWYRLLGRDLMTPPATRDRQDDRNSNTQPLAVEDENVDLTIPTDPVASWLDSATLPSMARSGLVAASGIEVPGSPFVLRVILAYLVALVPMNWLVCRFVFRRRELAWAIVPLLSLGFAVAVERAAAIDTGYDRACDEIDVLELQPGYPRAHLSRFAVLYSTGRETFSISYPGEPSALALPLNANLAIRGEQTTESTFQATPTPALIDFRVEPRSLAMFRGEQMVDLRGGISIGTNEDGERVLINQTELNLRDAFLVDVGAAELDQESLNLARPIGEIPAGSVVPVPESPRLPTDGTPLLDESEAEEGRPEWVNLPSFLLELSSYHWKRPEDSGELRLVAWAEGPMPGQELEPTVDRHRGFTLVVAHLSYGPCPSPDSPIYSSYQP